MKTFDRLNKQSQLTTIGPVFADQLFRYYDDFGIGYLPMSASNDSVYNASYFQDYIKKQSTRMGQLLISSRVEYTTRSTLNSKSVCDIGIGAGGFVHTYGCKGFDVNPIAVEYLKTTDNYGNPYEQEFDYITLWDVLEHIECPKELFDKVKIGVVMSTPIYSSMDNILTSKHFKPNEHLWYFTDSGLKYFMKQFGFECITQHNEETLIGRESIGSYFFKRV
jgi:2-polyprenyl-3-methyl-5-hydroxy-6-metoxy-1,4-benzoquinol methylase